jgi:hypothetical protein
MGDYRFAAGHNDRIHFSIYLFIYLNIYFSFHYLFSLERDEALWDSKSERHFNCQKLAVDVRDRDDFVGRALLLYLVHSLTSVRLWWRTSALRDLSRKQRRVDGGDKRVSVWRSDRRREKVGFKRGNGRC